MTDEQHAPSRIPEFASIEEEAEFWDSHDLSDYWDELRPVRVHVSPNLTSVHHFLLDADDYADLDRAARARGIDASALARQWLKERLRAERAG